MISKLLKQIRQKRQRAKRDGIEIISAEQLTLLAIASPHWRKIGRGKGKYNFCRRDHSIGYTAENTFIGSSEENQRERNARCGLPIYKSNLSLEQRKQRHLTQQKIWRTKNRENYNAQYRARYHKKKAAAALTAATASHNSTSTGG